MSTVIAHEVSSEIYNETDFQTVNCGNGRVCSKFKFSYPRDVPGSEIVSDEDGDLIVPRIKRGSIEIEHQSCSVLKLVGLQVWRGSLLLADFIFHNSKEFTDKKILELGAGVGLTSIAAGIFCEKVICTDMDVGGILKLIEDNVERNKHLLSGSIYVTELNFQKSFSDTLRNSLIDVDVIIAADVIYDDDVTDCFIEVLDKILDKNNVKTKTIYVALEKRYVFTVSGLDTSAPCFEYFLRKTDKKIWKIKYIPITFPQYFQYERCKELVLLEITNN